MDTIIEKKYKSYTIGSTTGLSDRQMDQLTTLFEQPPETSDTVLGGRGGVICADLDGIGSIVIKQYYRGGIVRHFIKQKYFQCGKTRSGTEFEFLKLVRNLGVGAPEPVAFASKGFIFYNAWLVTMEIKNQRSLADLSLADEQQALNIMEQVAKQMAILIHNKILHVDLHPGNILATGDNHIYFIDFDKARLFAGNKKKLANRYISRWHRAVAKHGLPESLSSSLRNSLKV